MKDTRTIQWGMEINDDNIVNGYGVIYKCEMLKILNLTHRTRSLFLCSPPSCCHFCSGNSFAMITFIWHETKTTFYHSTSIDLMAKFHFYIILTVLLWFLAENAKMNYCFRALNIIVIFCKQYIWFRI